MIQSIFTYGVFSLFLFGLGNISAKKGRIANQIGVVKNFWTWDIVLALVFFALISGIRWKVGVDHLSYLASYVNIKAGGDFRARGVEPGFGFITKLFASLDIHFTIYFAFWAFLQLFFIYYALKDERYLLPFIGLVLIMGPHYLNWMNGIRQTLAACIFVYSVQFLKNKQFTRYLIIIVIASLIHKTAILLLIFYFIPQKDYFKNRFITIILLILSVLLGRISVWMNFIDSYVAIFNFIGYDEYIQRLDIIIENERNLAFGPRRIISTSITLLIILHSKKLKAYFKNTNFLLFYNFSIVGEIYFNFFASANHIFRRPATYFTIFTIITTSYLLYYLKKLSIKSISFKFFIIISLLIVYMLGSIYAEYPKGINDYTNYKFFWNYI